MLRNIANAKILVCGLQSKKGKDKKAAGEKIEELCVVKPEPEVKSEVGFTDSLYSGVTNAAHNLANLASGVKGWFTGSNQENQEKHNDQKEL